MRNVPCFPFLVCALTAITAPVWVALPAGAAPVPQAAAQDGDAAKILPEFLVADKPLEDLSAHLQQTIVIEGELTLADRKAITAFFTSASPEESPRGTLDKLASSLDCTVREEGNVLLLLRDYCKSTALPSVTVEEVEHTSQNLNALLAQFDNTSDFAGAGRQDGSYAAGFLSQIADEQRPALQQGVPVTSLSPAQQQECFRLVSFVAFGMRIAPLRIVQQDIEAIVHGEGDFLMKPLKPSVKTSVFGYDYVSQEGHLQQRPLSHPDANYVRGAVPFIPLRGFALSGDRLAKASDLAQATEPETEQAVSSSAYTLTLDTICTRLNRTGLTEPVQAVPAVGRKRCTVYGMNLSVPETLLKAICQLHGLRVNRRPDASGTIVRYVDLPPASRPVTVSELPMALREAFPAPLSRVLRQLSKRDASQLLKDTALSPAERFKRERALMSSRDFLLRLRTQATKRLRELVEPQMDDSDRIALSKSGREAKDIIALLQLLDLMDTVETLTAHPLPEVMTKFPQLSIKAGTVKSDSGAPVINLDGNYIYEIIMGPIDDKGKVQRNTVMGFPIKKPLD